MLPFQYKYMKTYICIPWYAAVHMKTEAQVNIHNPLTVCSSYKRKFVICPFIDKETHRSYSFANELNGLNELAHL
jgi:hypothetical protein